MKVTLLLLLSILTLSSCSSKEHSNTETVEHADAAVSESLPENTIRTVMDEQVEFQFGEKTDPEELGLYRSLSIIVGDSVVLTFRDEFYEFEGERFKLDETHKFNTRQGTFYRVELNNRPEPPVHWFFQYSDNQIEYVGEINPLDLKYIGDADMDGKIEVSGYQDYCQETYIGESDKQDFCAEYFASFEVSDTVERVSYSYGVASILKEHGYLPSPVLEDPFVFGDFYGDGIQDTALIATIGDEHKLLVVDYQSDTALINIVEDGGETIQTTDFSWVGVFKAIPAGDTLFSNYTDDWRSLSDVPEDERVVLTYDALFVHMAEACGGGFIFWKDEKWNWLQQE
ncbi:hypothetical protein [Phaeocystidibacter luteus]|uniref:VCBS repeat-containing protein n=1 Tax=Phaeocystidibacter luteus TaxID=911197 RepID=A0A6N6RI64_9FLAO|nr:hypothetical protein [Phaeocystidibacter luteus]KAB2809977.1 hypothetical protein F8C67_08845 [Phaeocystidibacter luteus]